MQYVSIRDVQFVNFSFTSSNLTLPKIAKKLVKERQNANSSVC